MNRLVRTNKRRIRQTKRCDEGEEKTQMMDKIGGTLLIQRNGVQE